MDRYYSQTLGTTVLTTSGMPAGRICEIVIEPETGKVAGFLLEPRGEYVIAPADVLFWDENIFIHDEEDILPTGEIIKVRQTLENEIPILRSKVYTKKGLFLGKVYDIGINPKLFVMTKIVVAKNIFGLFPYDEKIIAHGDILEIKKDRVIVKDVEATVPVKEKARAKESLQIDIAPSTMGDLK
jgi:sporulation protein YlmC with PRC-barrel domain